MVDRTTAPGLREIKNLELPKPEVTILDNGIPVYFIEMGTQEILKLEIIFRAGRWYEDKKLISRATAALLKEGTQQLSGAEIAEKMDFYGASLGFPANLDTSNIVLFCLTKHFNTLIPIVTDLLTQPAFPQEEIKKFKKRSQRRLKVDLGKADVVAYRQITEAIFGKDHPYGYNSVSKLYDEVQREAIVQHFNQHYRAGNCTIILSGKPNKDILEQLNKTLGQLPSGRSIIKSMVVEPSPQRKQHLSKKKALQTAIRIGRKTFKRSHPDFQGMYVLNTLLGGYFGSRLMMNLREEKGYTYGVYSLLEPMLYDGYFYLSAEVGKEVRKEAIHEIYHELKRLRDEPVSDKEMQMVRNYMQGTLLNYLDGPFNVAEVIKTLVSENVEFSYFDELVHTVKNITPFELQALANKYFQPEDMFEVVVG